MGFIKSLPCGVCGAYSNIEVHHITHCGRRLGHYFTLPLCIFCHRGERGFSGNNRGAWDKSLESQLAIRDRIYTAYRLPMPQLPTKVINAL